MATFPGLAAELPALLAVLTVRLGEIPRVSYNLTEWDTAPRQIGVGGVRVRLFGFWSRTAHTVDVVAADRRRITLLLVPPCTDPSAAHLAMMRAVRRDNSDTVEDLLSAGILDATDSAWEARGADGGRIPRQAERESR